MCFTTQILANSINIWSVLTAECTSAVFDTAVCPNEMVAFHFPLSAQALY